jgi:hypothetical protein
MKGLFEFGPLFHAAPHFGLEGKHPNTQIYTPPQSCHPHQFSSPGTFFFWIVLIPLFWSIHSQASFPPCYP